MTTVIAVPMTLAQVVPALIPRTATHAVEVMTRAVGTATHVVESTVMIAMVARTTGAQVVRVITLVPIPVVG